MSSDLPPTPPTPPPPPGAVPPPPMAAPPPPSGSPLDAPAPRRLHFPFHRSGGDRYLAGLAGGAGRRFGVDPLFLRVGTVAFALLWSPRNSAMPTLVLAAYLIAWIVVPVEGGTSLLRRIATRDALQEIAAACLLFLGAVVVIDRPNVVWIGLLFGIAALLLGGRPPVENAAPVTAPPGADPAEPGAVAVQWGRSLRRAVGPRDAVDRPLRTRAVRPRRNPALWPMTVALLFAGAIGAAMLDRLMEPGLDPAIAVNGAILVVGGVLMLAGWRGRAWGSTFLLVPLVPPWIAFSMADVGRFDDDVRSVEAGAVVADGDELRFEHGYGGLYVNLTNLELPEHGEIRADVRLTSGQVDLWVPKEADLQLVGHLGLASVSVFVEDEYWDRRNEQRVDWTLDRTYQARGVECSRGSIDDAALVEIAAMSGIRLDGELGSGDVADMIEAAGYARPVEYVVDESWETYDDNGNAVVEAVEAIYWEYDSNDNGALCRPTPPPDDPLRIVVDVTVGLGRLQVHRV